MRHADDRIHRRADLVAHIGQKITFGLVGFVSKVFGLYQFIFHVLALGDVGKHAERADLVAVCIQKRRGIDQAGHEGSIRTGY